MTQICVLAIVLVPAVFFSILHRTNMDTGEQIILMRPGLDNQPEASS